MVSTSRKVAGVQEKVKKKLIAKRKDIKNKLNILKHGQVEHENLFQPITKHLQKIEDKLEPHQETRKKGKLSHFQELANDDDDDDDENNGDYDISDHNDDKNFQFNNDQESVVSEPIPFTSTPVEFKNTPKGTKFGTPASAPHLKRKLKFSTVSKQQPPNLRKQIIKGMHEEWMGEERQKQKDYEKKLDQTIREKSFNDYEEQYHPLPFKYVKKFVKDPNNDNSDGKFRVKFNRVIEEFSIGNKRIDFDGPDLIVAGKKFKGTQGLYGLLFNQNVPSTYTKQDAKNYVQILQKTNALKRNFNPNSEFITSKNMKFKKIVEPFLGHNDNNDDDDGDDADDDDGNYNSEVQGRGIGDTNSGKGIFMKVSNNPIDHIYWDDPNELVERLKLLLASQTAGNTGHTNEINSIIEELREANIIE